MTIAGTRYVIRAFTDQTPAAPPTEQVDATLTLDRDATGAATGLAWSIRDWNGFTASSTAFTGDTTHTKALATGDLNGDGRADLVSGNGGEATRIYDGTSGLATGTDLGVFKLDLDDAGPYLRVEGDDVVIVVAGQRLEGSFRFTQRTVNGTRIVQIDVPSAHISLADGLIDLDLSRHAADLTGRHRGQPDRERASGRPARPRPASSSRARSTCF